MGSEAGAYISTGSMNTFVGMSAGEGITGTKLTGDRNVAIGVNAGVNLQGAATENIIIGAFAGDGITTGHSSVIIGDSAGSGTIGSGNVAIGHNALTSGTSADSVVIGNNAGLQTTGNDNVIIGVDAGSGATSITQCTIVGANAGSGATLTGDNNTLMGRAAGNALTSGSENTFVGAEAGDGTDDGADCVAVGFRALSGNCGSSNVAVGVNAGIAVTGTTNTLIGKGAGSGLGNGSENVFIGDQAGTRGTDAATTGSCILIGHDTGTSASDSTSQILLGVDTQATTDSTFHVGIGSNLISIPINGSTTTFSASSDERLKENVTTSTAGLSFLKDLRPVTYNWKKKKDVPSNMPYFYEEDSNDPCVGEGKTYHGFVAQEIKTALDNHTEIKDGQDLWHEDDHGTQRVSPAALVPILVKAIQELEARIATLEG